MSHKKTDWEPKGANHTFNGFRVYDHGVHADDHNDGEQDPDWKADHESDDHSHDDSTDA